MPPEPLPQPPFELRFEYANENRQATIALGGTAVAILTFLLIFFSGDAGGVGLRSILYRGTLLSIIVSIFFLGLSGSYYYFLLEALERGRSDAARFLERADQFFVAGLTLLLLEPSLILLTLGVYDIGAVALALWAISLIVIARGRAELATPSAGRLG